MHLIIAMASDSEEAANVMEALVEIPTSETEIHVPRKRNSGGKVRYRKRQSKIGTSMSNEIVKTDHKYSTDGMILNFFMSNI